MNNEYRHDSVRYLFNVTVPSIIAIPISIYSGYRYYISQSKFFLLILISCIIIVLDHTVSITRPQIIRSDNNGIELIAFGKSHIYKWNEVSRINLRKGAFSNKIYLRLGDTSFLKGRYWINVDMYNNGDKLISNLKKREAELHPMLKRFNKRSTKAIR